MSRFFKAIMPRGRAPQMIITVQFYSADCSGHSIHSRGMTSGERFFGRLKNSLHGSPSPGFIQ